MPVVPLQLAGLNEDQPSWSVPPDTWTRAENIRFADRIATRINGSVFRYDDPIDIPIHLLNSDFDGFNYWLYGGQVKIGVVDTVDTHFDITPVGYTGQGEADGYTSFNFNGFPVLNIDGNPPVWWDRNTANVCETIPGWPVGARAYAMRPYKDFLLALGYYDGSNNFPDQLTWSDSADSGALPQEWGAAADNLAGSLSFGDTPGAIIDGLGLRGSFIVYKASATYLLSFIGGSFVFSKKRLFTTSGVLARNCVAEVEGLHVVLTDSDVIVHDSNQPKSIMDARTRRNLFANIDQDNYANSYVFNNKSRDEVWVCVPESGVKYANIAYVWDKDGNLLGKRDLKGTFGTNIPHIAYGNLSAAGTPRPWEDQLYPWTDATFSWVSGQSNVFVAGGLAADLGAKFQAIDLGDDPAVGTIRAKLARESLDFGDAGTTKYVRAVWPRIEGADGDIINVRVGSQFQADEPIDWGPLQPFRVNQDRKTNHAVVGRYLSFEFSSDGGKVFRMPGFSVEFGDGQSMY